MKTLQIDETKAKGLYATATPEFKEMLHDSFGKDFFTQKITDRLKTFSDVCEVLGVDQDEFNEECYDNDYTPDEKAYRQLKLIAKALNEGWTPDWKNRNEAKYFTWFEIDQKTGTGFADVDYGGWCTDAIVGSRLCFRSRELAEYAGNQFKEIYKAFML